MKHLQTFENFLNEAMRDSSKEYNDMRYEIWYQAPKGYFAKGIGEMKGKIETSYFETSEEAEEHAEAEIDGYLGESLSENKQSDMKHIKTYESFLSEVSEKKQELGLYVIGRTSRDNTKIGEWLKNSDFHAEWNAREGYWLFPADDESEYDELERELDMQFANHGIDARFEGIFESSVNESMETIVDDPTAPGVFARIKKNKQEYRDVIKHELNKKFDMEDSGMLFPHQYKEGVGYYTFSMDEGMGETTARIIFPNSQKDKEKEKFAKKVADHISKFVEKDSKINKIENGPSYTGDIANAFADPQNGNWTITWRPKFFVRKQN